MINLIIYDLNLIDMSYTIFALHTIKISKSFSMNSIKSLS